MIYLYVKKKICLYSIFEIFLYCVYTIKEMSTSWFFFNNRSCLIYFWMQCLSILVMMSCFPLWGTKWRETSSMPSSNPQNLSGNCFNIYHCLNLYKSLDILCNIKILDDWSILVHNTLYANIPGNFILTGTIVLKMIVS